MSHANPRTKQYELEVQKIIHLKSLAYQLPNEFTDPKSVTKSYLLVANAPIKMDVPVGQSNIIDESQSRMKHGKPFGSKDKNTQTRKGAKTKGDPSENIKTLK